jgi:hypothetical protein
VRAAVHRRKASRVSSTDLPAKPKHANGGQDAGGHQERDERDFVKPVVRPFGRRRSAPWRPGLVSGKTRMPLPTGNAGIISGSSQSPDMKPKKRRRFVALSGPSASSNHCSASLDQNSRSSASTAAAANLLHSCALVLRNF